MCVSWWNRQIQRTANEREMIIAGKHGTISLMARCRLTLRMLFVI
jgi:hypothetical protein